MEDNLINVQIFASRYVDIRPTKNELNNLMYGELKMNEGNEKLNEI